MWSRQHCRAGSSPPQPTPARSPRSATPITRCASGARRTGTGWPAPLGNLRRSRPVDRRLRCGRVLVAGGSVTQGICGDAGHPGPDGIITRTADGGRSARDVRPSIKHSRNPRANASHVSIPARLPLSGVRRVVESLSRDGRGGHRPLDRGQFAGGQGRRVRPHVGGAVRPHPVARQQPAREPSYAVMAMPSSRQMARMPSLMPRLNSEYSICKSGDRVHGVRPADRLRPDLSGHPDAATA